MADTDNPTSFRLSDEAKATLADIAKRWHTTQTAALEAIINEFSPSTPEERAIQGRDRQEALACFLRERPQASVMTAWKAGYSAGWELFQVRKLTSVFRHGSTVFRGRFRPPSD